MSSPRRLPPVWMMGLSAAPLGLYIGFYTIVFPAMLALRGVPGNVIASMIGTATLAFACSPFLGPILDFRLSRKTYAVLLASIAAATIPILVVFPMSLALVQSVLIAGTLSAGSVFGVVGAWTSSLVPTEDRGKLGAWLSVSNVGSLGLMAVLAGQLNHLRHWEIAFSLAALLMLPTLLYLPIPTVKPDFIPAAENFKLLFRSIGQFVKRREVQSMMVLFLAPCGCFALANILAGFGKDFAADERTVDLFGGVGSSIAGVVGSLMLPLFARRFPLRPIYIVTGCVGALFSMGLILLPHTPATFALAISGEQMFQALASSALYVLIFESIGRNNPSASTLNLFLNSVSVIPFAYMSYLDGFVYTKRGLPGMFLGDAATGLFACVAFAVAFRLLPQFFSAPAAEIVDNAI